MFVLAANIFVWNASICAFGWQIIIIALFEAFLAYYYVNSISDSHQTLCIAQSAFGGCHAIWERRIYIEMNVHIRIFDISIYLLNIMGDKAHLIVFTATCFPNFR